MARLYADENFPIRVVRELRRMGHDVATIQERGLAGVGFADPGVLAAATGEGRAVLSQNRRDFIKLHKASQVHAGIIVCSEDRDVARLAARIHTALPEDGELAGQLLRVNRPSS